MKKSQSDIFSFKNITIILIASIIFMSGWTIHTSLMDEKELYNYVHQPTSSGKGTGFFMLVMYKYFGRIGVIIEPWLLEPIIIVAWFGSYQEHKKAKAKEREILQKEQEQLAQLSKRKSWRKKQEQKRKKHNNY